jgi:hypothetical protein
MNLLPRLSHLPIGRDYPNGERLRRIYMLKHVSIGKVSHLYLRNNARGHVFKKGAPNPTVKWGGKSAENISTLLASAIGFFDRNGNKVIKERVEACA